MTRFQSGLNQWMETFLDLIRNLFPEQNQMTRDDFVISCGDFGGGRDPAFAF